MWRSKTGGIELRAVAVRVAAMPGPGLGLCVPFSHCIFGIRLFVLRNVSIVGGIHVWRIIREEVWYAGSFI